MNMVPSGYNFPVLLFWPGFFIYIGRGVDARVHGHHAIQIAIALETSIDVITEAGTFVYQAVIIDSDMPHECRTYGTSFLLINIDPETNIGAVLRKDHLHEGGMAELPAVMIEKYLGQLKLLLSAHDQTNEIFQLTNDFLFSMAHTQSFATLDARIEKVLELLRQPAQENMKVKELAAMVHISPGRLIHLFTEQVGIPIRKYMLWAKILASLTQLNEGANYTHVALDSGFSDAPHFNRTFKRMFGVSPTALVKSRE